MPGVFHVETNDARSLDGVPIPEEVDVGDRDRVVALETEWTFYDGHGVPLSVVERHVGVRLGAVDDFVEGREGDGLGGE